MLIERYSASGKQQFEEIISNANRTIAGAQAYGTVIGTPTASLTVVSVSSLNELVYQFSTGASDLAAWPLLIPKQYQGGSARIILYCSAASTGGDFDIDIEIANTTTGGLSASFGSAVSFDGNTAPSSTSDQFKIVCDLTNAQFGTASAEDSMVMKITRDGSSDANTGELRLHKWQIIELA